MKLKWLRRIGNIKFWPSKAVTSSRLWETFEAATPKGALITLKTCNILITCIAWNRLDNTSNFKRALGMESCTTFLFFWPSQPKFRAIAVENPGIGRKLWSVKEFFGGDKQSKQIDYVLKWFINSFGPILSIIFWIFGLLKLPYLLVVGQLVMQQSITKAHHWPRV